MANSLLSGNCLPVELRSSTVNRQALRAHALPTRRACRPLKRLVDRSTKVQAHATEAPTKSKVRPGEKKGSVVCWARFVAFTVFEIGLNSATPDLPVAKTTGFVEEMRFVAMKLHTKDQAPKEGGKEAAPQPFQKVLQLVAVVPRYDDFNCVVNASAPEKARTLLLL